MRQLTPEQRHKRETRNQIMLPMLGAVLVLVVMLVAAIMLLNPTQFSLVADFFAIFTILIPNTLICLIPTIALMVAAIGLWKGTTVAARPLGRLRSRAVTILQKVQAQVPRAAAPVIFMQSKLSQTAHIARGRTTAVSPEKEE
jgi:high-affinity K+ transport system ATPase subunit B